MSDNFNVHDTPSQNRELSGQYYRFKELLTMYFDAIGNTQYNHLKSSIKRSKDIIIYYIIMYSGKVVHYLL